MRIPRSSPPLTGLLAGACAVGCALVSAALVLGQLAATSYDRAVAVAWVSGLAAAVLGVAARQEHADPDDDPRYLETLVAGLRAEWRR